MYDKGQVITRIGEENWEDFENFMYSRKAEYDENGLQIYYEGDVDRFEQLITKQ